MKVTGLKRTWLQVFLPLALIVIFVSSIQTQPAMAVDSGPTFNSVTSGEHFTCGLTTSGEVYCWGASDRSQLGTSAVADNSTPNKVYQISNAVEIASGRDFACARLSDGGVACWGRGDLGQTGDGLDTKIDRIFATRVQSVNTAVGIAAGFSHACVLLADGTIQCWGENQFYQLGNETSSIETMPVRVEGIPLSKAISSGANHTCALAENGFVYCWGDNKFGQLGIGTMTTLRSKPSVVLGVKKVNKIQMGYDSSCASVETTGFTCWGSGVNGQLAETDRFNRSLPVPITLSTLTDSATALVSISIGRTKACGLLNSARSNLMYCWGTTVTTDPVSGSSATSVSLGSDHGCTVTTTGTVQCWGWNHKGQLGLGTIRNAVTSIATVSGFPDWTYWINTWSVKFDENLGILTWTGGTGKYIVSIEGQGIVCETLLGIKTCKFGPLKSDTTYYGTITAQNNPLSLSRTANISFTTGKLVSALEQYANEVAAAAKAKADLEKANLFLAALTKQIDASDLLTSKALSQLALMDAKTQNETLKLEKMSAQIYEESQAVSKIRKMIEETFSRILKKTGN
jgi:alpha-tubulin suppressor-like RCC1 family protein